MGAGGGSCVMSSPCCGSRTKSSHGNGMEDTSIRMARLHDGKPIWRHQSLTAVWPYLLAHDTPTPERKHPPCIDAASAAAGHSYISGHWGYSLRDLHFPSACLQTLTASLCRRKDEKIGTPKKRNMEEFDGFLILVRNQTWSEREGAQLQRLSGVWQ